MNSIPEVASAVAMIAALLLGYFGMRLWKRAETRSKGVLMVVTALVLVVNVVIWTV